MKALTACGIETRMFLLQDEPYRSVATVPTACGIETNHHFLGQTTRHMIVATVPTACGMRRRVPAEEQSDDEDRTSLVPDRREGKTKVMK